MFPHSRWCVGEIGSGTFDWTNNRLDQGGPFWLILHTASFETLRDEWVLDGCATGHENVGTRFGGGLLSLRIESRISIQILITTAGTSR